MNDEMKRQVSALIDGELEDHEIEPVLRGLGTHADLSACWDDYQCIGAVLRDDGDPGIDIASGVMARLAEEPTVLAPSARQRSAWQRPSLALAASLAGVTLVGMLALTPPAGRDAAVIASSPVSAAAAKAPSSPKSAITPRLQEYLVAHQAHAPAAGASRSIRTVAMAGGDR